jgi:hypothetical protein
MRRSAAYRRDVTDDRFERAIAAIDAANAQDPNFIRIGGQVRPKELGHAELVTEWVHRLEPEPSEALLLAARAHHLRRWTLPRSTYGDDREGYLKWRKVLQIQHASETRDILRAVDYDDATIGRVQDLIRKIRLGKDREVQVLEDALCLVFIQTQLRDLAARLDAEKMSGVIERTKKKMSDRAVELALGLDLTPDERALLLGSSPR